jgi:hypothetical protein
MDVLIWIVAPGDASTFGLLGGLFTSVTAPFAREVMIEKKLVPRHWRIGARGVESLRSAGSLQRTGRPDPRRHERSTGSMTRTTSF